MYMSKILNKQTGRMVKPDTVTGKAVINEQYGGAVPPTAVSPKAAFLLESVKKSNKGDQISWVKNKTQGVNNVDSYMIINNGDNTYDVCLPGESNCPHEGSDFDYVTRFVNDMAGFGDFEGYNNIFINDKHVSTIKG